MQQVPQALAQLYLVVGEDVEARRRHLAAIEAKLAAEAGGPCDRLVFDAEEAPLEQVGEAIEVTPLFPGPRLVWIQHMDKAGAELQAYLVERLPPKSGQTVVVLSAAAADRRAPWFRELGRKGRVVQVDPPAARDIPTWIMQKAKALGFRLSRQGADALHALVGDDTAALTTELEKLALHADGEGTVGPRLVEELVSRAMPWAAEHAVFQLVDAVVEGRAAEAYRMLRQLRSVGKPPLLILHMLARQYRLLVAACGRPGITADQLAEAMGIRAYPARKVLGQARAMTLARAIQGLEAILEADLQMKTSSGDEMLILEMLIGRLSAR